MATPAKRLFRPPVRPTRRLDWATSRPTYRPRQPTATPLYPIVQHHLETLVARAAESDPLGYGVPTWVEQDFRAYLRCGILAYGFARARCDDCAHERLIALSCKGRGICPSCNTRRMAEVAAHLTDHFLPHLPVRQWVLSLPKRLRPYLHHNPDVAGAVLGIFLRAIRTTLRRTSPGAAPAAQLGAVSFLHRFGSALNPHFHFHIVVLDGVFAHVPDDPVRFYEATLLDQHHWLDLQRVVQHRVLRYFRTRGLLDEADAEGMPGTRRRRVGQGSGGFSIDAAGRIQGNDRAGVERLLRYCARPPFALERLHALGGSASLSSPEARLLYRFPRPTPDGRTEILLSPLQLLECIADQRFASVPSSRRPACTAIAATACPPRAPTAGGSLEPDRPSSPSAGPRQSRPRPWTPHRPYPSLPFPIPSLFGAQAPRGSDGPCCSHAGTDAKRWSRGSAAPLPGHRAKRGRGGQMSIPALPSASSASLRSLTDPPVVCAILLHLHLPHRPPAVAPARAPPQGDFLLDQTAAFDPTDADPEPNFQFDQSLPPDLDD